MPTRYFQRVSDGAWLRGVMSFRDPATAPTITQAIADRAEVYGALACVEVADGGPDPRTGTLVESPVQPPDPDETALRAALADVAVPVYVKAIIRRLGVR